MSDQDSTKMVKAVAEGTASGVVGELIAPVAGFLRTLLGPATDQLGGWAGDAIELRRWKSRVRMIQRAESFLLEAGLEAHSVPLPILMPILEAGGNEEDASMRERWAVLLASAAGRPGTVSARFPSILRDLDPRDARLLDAIVASSDQVLLLDANRMEIDVPEPTIDLVRLTNGELSDAWAISADNLIALGLCATRASSRTAEEDRTHLRLTSLGRAFVAACDGRTTYLLWREIPDLNASNPLPEAGLGH